MCFPVVRIICVTWMYGNALNRQPLEWDFYCIIDPIQRCKVICALLLRNSIIIRKGSILWDVLTARVCFLIQIYLIIKVDQFINLERRRLVRVEELTQK